MTITEESFSAVSAEITELQNLRKTDLCAFLGDKCAHGGRWNGSGISRAKKLQESLSRGPDNFASQAVQDHYRRALAAVSELVAG